MRYFLKELFEFLIGVERWDISKMERLLLILDAFVNMLRIRRLYFRAKVLCDFLIIKKNRQSVYKLKDLNKGLRNNTQRNPISDEAILRIANAYIEAKTDQGNQPQVYQAGGEWELTVAGWHEDLKSELKKKNVDKSKALLSDFARNKRASGLQPHGVPLSTTIGKLACLNWMNKSYPNWKNLTSLPDEALQYRKEIGNIPGVEVSGGVIPVSAFRLSYYTHKICNLLQSIEHPTVMEIGAGFGGVAYHIFEHCNLRCTYIDFDLPEFCIIASYFLMSNFPDKKILLYGESDIADIDLSQYDIIIMPNYVVKDLPEKSCDLVFNSHSLGEMDYSTVREYLRQVNRVTKKYFLHANDERRLLYWTPSHKLKRRVNLNDPNFELPKEDFKRLYRVPEIIHNDGGYADRGFEQSYFEYFYERVSSVSKAR